MILKKIVTRLIFLFLIFSFLPSCSQGYYGTPDAGAASMETQPGSLGEPDCSDGSCDKVLVTEPDD